MEKWAGCGSCKGAISSSPLNVTEPVGKVRRDEACLLPHPKP